MGRNPGGNDAELDPVPCPNAERDGFITGKNTRRARLHAADISRKFLPHHWHNICVYAVPALLIAKCRDAGALALRPRGWRYLRYVDRNFHCVFVSTAERTI